MPACLRALGLITCEMEWVRSAREGRRTGVRTCAPGVRPNPGLKWAPSAALVVWLSPFYTPALTPCGGERPPREDKSGQGTRR